MLDIKDFVKEIGEKGWVKFPNMLNASQLTVLNNDIELAYQTCRKVQIQNGLDANTDGTVHHILGQEPSFLEFVQQLPLYGYILEFFGNPYIINSFGGVINMPQKASYVCNVHRDIRTFYSLPMMINMLVMLDDFTVENGATHFLDGSHKVVEKPTDEDFYKQASRAIGKAGDIILFDSLLWHAAGVNHSNNVRRALTLTFTRPFQKQQLDYPRFIGWDKMDTLTDIAKQVLGYNSRVPSNLNEWYQPIDKRFYKPGQG
jgi:Phytanoyl-CoA dioxygenase (PhyH)